jgi:hypothetical protein
VHAGLAAAATAAAGLAGGGSSASAAVRRDNFFRDAGQIGYNSRSTRWACATTCTPATAVGRLGGSDAQLERLGIDHRAGRRTSFQGTPIFYLAAFQQQGSAPCRRSTRSSARRASSERHDQRKNWTFNVGLLASRTRCTARG